jgi:hypothetical protein
MINRNVARAALVGVAASAAVGLAVTAFAAAPTFHITAGSHTSGTIAYTGKATGTSSKPAIQFNDNTTHLSTTCVSGTASGTIKLGAHVSGTGAANITKTTWKTCTAAGGLKLTPKQPSTSKWTLNAVARPVKGVTKVFIGNVTANVTTNIGCKGSADGTYNNTTGKLAVAPRSGSGHQLKATNVNNSCLGEVNNGDNLVFKGTYTVTTSAGKIKIS